MRISSQNCLATWALAETHQPRRRQPWEDSLTYASDTALAVEIDGYDIMGHTKASFQSAGAPPPNSPQHHLEGVVFEKDGPTEVPTE